MDSTLVAILRTLADGKKHSFVSLENKFSLTHDELIQKLHTVASDLEISLNLRFQYCFWKYPFVSLDKEVILSYLLKSIAEFELLLLDRVDSTNNYLKALLKKNLIINFQLNLDM